MLKPTPTLALLFAFAACGGPLLPEQHPRFDAGQPAEQPPGGAGQDGGSTTGGAADAGVASRADAGPGSGAPDAGSPTPPPAPPGPTIAGCPIFPATDAFNRDVSRDPVDPNSADYLAHMQAGSLFLHPDFGMPQYGEPVATVSGSQPRVPMRFTYAFQSDPGPYPFPQNVPIQGGAASSGDRHAVVIDTEGCQLYETYNTWPDGQGGFRADSGARFDLRTGALRPDQWTSATASGLPIFPGLSRFDEVVEQGAVRHALTFTAGSTAHSFVHPATHSSGTSGDLYAPPMGLRVRLRADYDLSRFHGASLVLLQAMKRYGMMLIDNTDPSMFWAFGGVQDPRWPTQDLEQMKTVPASAFEVIRLGPRTSGQ